MDINIGFVILHYNNMDDTIEVVRSIKDMLSDGESYHIVIVDNASPNGSGKTLKSLYEGDSDVTVLLNEKNFGFSAGNNIGIHYIRKFHKPSFIVVSNNDIVFFGKSFYRELSDFYSETHFAVVGPLVLSGDLKYNSNPQLLTPISKEEAEQEIRHFKKLLRIYKLPRWVSRIYELSDYYLKKLSIRYSQRLHSYHESFPKSGYIKIVPDVVLHGCCLIFSPTYFEYFEGFEERTFMYCEESILYWNIKSRNLKSYYYPRIVVYHKEGASVRLAHKGISSKIFRYRMKIESHESYLNFLAENNFN